MRRGIVEQLLQFQTNKSLYNVSQLKENRYRSDLGHGLCCFPHNQHSIEFVVYVIGSDHCKSVPRRA